MSLTVTISGPAGSGKTTVASVIYQLLKVFGFEPEFRDTDIDTPFSGPVLPKHVSEIAWAIPKIVVQTRQVRRR